MVGHGHKNIHDDCVRISDSELLCNRQFGSDDGSISHGVSSESVAYGFDNESNRFESELSNHVFNKEACDRVAASR